VSPGALKGERKREGGERLPGHTRRSLMACRRSRYRPIERSGQPAADRADTAEPGTPRWAATAQSVIPLRYLR